MIPQTKPYTSVYEPVMVKIGETEYALRKRNRTVMRQLAQIQVKLEAALEEANGEKRAELLYEQLGLLVDAPPAVIDDLDMAQVRDISNWILAVATGKVKPEGEDPGKNPERPGDETPAG